MYNLTSSNTELKLNSSGNIGMAEHNPSQLLNINTSSGYAPASILIDDINTRRSYSHSDTWILAVEPFKLITKNIMQSKVAVFKVERDAEKGTVTKVEFLKEFWLNKVSGISLELLAAKEVEGFDPLTMVIKEIHSVNF